MAAPEPLFRVLYEPALDGIEVHVVHFLVLLPNAPDVEVVEAALPETAILRLRNFGPETHLGGRSSLAATASQCAGNPLLEDLHDGRWGSADGFAHQ